MRANQIDDKDEVAAQLVAAACSLLPKQAASPKKAADQVLAMFGYIRGIMEEDRELPKLSGRGVKKGTD